LPITEDTRPYKETYMDVDNVTLLFKSLLRPHLEYANVAWALSYKADLKKLEDVQRRATRLLPSLSGLDYTTRLHKLKLPSIAYRRKRGDMIEVYKCTHGIHRNNILEFMSDTRTRGHSLKLRLQSCKTRFRHNYFNQRVVFPLNSLPEELCVLQL